MSMSQLPPVVGHMPSTLDVSWFIDMRNSNQLELNPPYQRHSVWGLKDRRFFLDTIFRGFLCPPIYLHKTIVNGRAMYAVVDGKQRIESVFAFYDNKMSIPADFGNDRLDGKKWKDIENDSELVERFMNFAFPIENIINISSVKEIFDRLNRNSKILNPQELRHAKYQGWFISFVEQEAEDELWAKCRVWTKSSSKRMKDVQVISELLMLVLEGRIVGFDQDHIDTVYALYDSPQDVEADNVWGFPVIDEEDIKREFLDIRNKLWTIVQDDSVLTFIKDTKHLYSLWAYLVLKERDSQLPEFSLTKYKGLIEYCSQMKGITFSPTQEASLDAKYMYYINSMGASTEAPQRLKRQEALVAIMSVS